jgi:hypothetical protein
MRQTKGIYVTTAQSILFQLMEDATFDGFKQVTSHAALLQLCFQWLTSIQISAMLKESPPETGLGRL